MSAVETNTCNGQLLKKKEENKGTCYWKSIYNIGDLHQSKNMR